ncbi:glycoside hydrolase [Fibrisoma montanum]|uniref:Glycoside hydrolase n=1 Tax=Fibrisoma montanum TaxID=2305895 RepID=A0A418LWC7_9BACT|nr:glycosyl hydrolase [Fibrisoma montanum]RIV17590.1 glycoside hydrolase [Fibrisoma montanum]
MRLLGLWFGRLIGGLLLIGVLGSQASAQSYNTARPWTYWWWMGSAVNEKDITHQLEQFARAGLGGVHIIPIYGAKGYEQQFIPFLSERWLAVFSHTVREGKRLGLGVDLTTGTGWPFGGPNVTPEIAAKQWKLDGGKLTATLTKQQVKRAAPGGAGLVVDYFSREAMLQYLQRFDSTLNRLPDKPRAVYNDSYEAYGANWTTNFLAEFQKRRGYDLNSQLPALLDTTGSDSSVRVHQDYHQTLSDLLHDGFTVTWTNWARQRGYQSRNQAHGSPGNLLDLYALADIPETESFGSSRFPIPGLRVDENYEVDRFGTPNPLAMKFASSAAHLTGKKLVSSETGTWLADHFKVSLSQIKPQIDELFTSGINHVFYHGTTYSPQTAAWPGWLFYASTNYGPSSPVWPHLPFLNQYVERCQSRLQTSEPDNDVLVYFPMHDLWAKPAKSSGGTHQLEVHHVDRWLLQLPFGRLGEQLQQQGYALDFVSDALLKRLTAGPNGLVQSGNATYRVIVVPASTFMPETTLQALSTLAKQGVRIVFESAMPQQVPGYQNWQQRTVQIRQLGRSLERLKTVSVTANVAAALDQFGARRESWADRGLSFIRKKHGDTTQYFVANLNNQFTEDWISLATAGQSITSYNPLTGVTTPMAVRKGKAGQLDVWLRLLPGQSCFLNVVPRPASGGAPLAQPSGGRPQAEVSAIALSNPWQMQFGKGRPNLTTTATLPRLTSWTTLSDSAVYFWGTARYTTTFDLPTTTDLSRSFTLDLGDVRDVAEVRLNGQPLGTAWCLPYQLTIPASQLQKQGNRLEVDVTNLSANYMRLYDRQHPEWKRFYDINIVDIRYRPFDASRWEPMPSGLLGPVRLVPVP